VAHKGVCVCVFSGGWDVCVRVLMCKVAAVAEQLGFEWVLLCVGCIGVLPSKFVRECISISAGNHVSIVVCRFCFIHANLCLTLLA